MKNILMSVVALAGLILAVSVLGTLFIGLAVVGAVIYGLYFARNYLTQKGILNPTPGVSPQADEAERITIIEGDFTRVEEETK